MAAQEVLAQEAAEGLYAQHRGRLPFRPLAPLPSRPDEAFAYAVQDRLNALRKADGTGDIGGYKIGLTTPRMQALCNGDRPISGLVRANCIRPAPAVIETSGFVRLGIESELAVRLAHRLVPGVGPVMREDVAAAVGDIACAFELIEDRGADYETLDWLWLAADNSWNAGLVLGRAVPAVDVSDRSGILEIDGKQVDSGSTADVLGHPFDAVAWLANHLAARGLPLEAGHWISTGSIASIRFAEPGRHYRFVIEGLPDVVLTTA